MKPHLALYLLSADVADRLGGLGFTIRTPAAVRQAVLDGRLNPEGVTPRGVHVWTEDALLKDIERLNMIEYHRRAGLRLRRQPEAQQGELFGSRKD